jgi:hypothetical protein
MSARGILLSSVFAAPVTVKTAPLAKTGITEPEGRIAFKYHGMDIVTNENIPEGWTVFTTGTMAYVREPGGKITEHSLHDFMGWL